MLSNHEIPVITPSSSKYNCSPAMATCDGMYPYPQPVVAAVVPKTQIPKHLNT